MSDDKINILVCDDEPGLRLSVQMILNDNPNYNLILCKNGEEGLEKLSELSLEKWRRTILLTDNDMEKGGGKIKGIDLIAEVKKSYPEVQSILMSARLDKNENTGALEGPLAKSVQEIGCLGLAKMPWSVAALRDIVKQAEAKLEPAVAANETPRPKNWAEGQAKTAIQPAAERDQGRHRSN